MRSTCVAPTTPVYGLMFELEKLGVDARALPDLPGAVQLARVNAPGQPPMATFLLPRPGG